MDWTSVFNRLGGIVPACGDKYAPLSKLDIESLEEFLQSPLPEPYREFASQYGLSSFNEITYCRPIEPIPPWIGTLSWNNIALFFGGQSKKWDLYTVAFNRKRYYETGRVPRALLPIGSDAAGNLFCIGISGDHRGRVYYWHYRGEISEEEFMEIFGTPKPNGEFANVQLLANDFDDFLNRLYVKD